MGYIIADRLKISRPVLFLCGPYYVKTDSSDRRNILRENINEIYGYKKVLPLIVDLFLSSQNIDLEVYSIQLLEEICAAISSQTHIFLDTMSAATELGIFANSAYKNEIYVYVPKKSDVNNQENIGYFVREAVLKNPRNNIKTIEYRPKIIRRAYSSVYIAEHYGFNGDELPPNIKQELIGCSQKNMISCDCLIKYTESSDFPTCVEEITYSNQDGIWSARLSVKLLFYITVSIVHLEFPDIEKKESFTEEEILQVINLTKESIINTLSLRLCISKEKLRDMRISTILKYDTDKVIEHIIQFVSVYYAKSQFKSLNLIERSLATVLKRDIGKHPESIFQLNSDQYNLACKIRKNEEVYFDHIQIRSGKKIRDIVKYKEDENGKGAKELHTVLNKMFRKQYEHSEYSYAYHHGKSIKDCVSQHLGSHSFIKLDIKDFFGSVSRENMLEFLMKDFEIDVAYRECFDNILSSCFCNDKLPLGLVMSPILSDYYLNGFDREIGRLCDRKKYVYTRYADDILISSKTPIERDEYETMLEYIGGLLKQLNMKLNNDKSQYITFGKKNKFIKYVGVNIVVDERTGENYLSVGKKYIFDLAKKYMYLCDLKKQYDTVRGQDADPKLLDSIFYIRKEIVGKIGFVKLIEGERGIKRLEVRMKKYYPEIDLRAV